MTASREDKRKIMLIGCGHGDYHSCGREHPKDTFLTVDSNPKVKADLFLRVPSKEFSDKIGKRTFSTIIYEGVSVGYYSPLMLRDLVENNGNIIYAGFDIHSMLEVLDNNFDDVDSQVSFYWLKPTRLFDDIPVVCFSISKPSLDEKQIPVLTLGKSLNVYFNKILKANDFQHIPIRDNFNEFIERSRFLEELQRSHNLKFIGRISVFSERVIFDESKPAPVTLQELRDIAASYKPGHVRSLFSKKGQTQGMQQLKAFFSSCNEGVLSMENLQNILEIASARRERLRRNKNPFRYTEGSTSEVFAKIILRVTTYLASGLKKRNEFIELLWKKQSSAIKPK